MFFNRRKNDKRFRRGNNDTINDTNENSGEIIEFTQEEEPITNKTNIQNETPITEINLNNKRISNNNTFLKETFLSQKHQRAQSEIEHENKIFSPITSEIDYIPLDTNKNKEEIVFESENEEDDNDKIIKEKIKLIKEIKEHQRKCLLQENEDGLYGKGATPKEMIKEIYSIIEEKDDINNYTNEIESDNEKMINKWENEQYKSGLNLNNIKRPVEHSKEENLEDVLNTLSDKILGNKDDYNTILRNIDEEIKKDKQTVNIVDMRKKEYQSEIVQIKKNEFIIKEKLDKYINQYYKVKNEILKLIDENDDDDEDNIFNNEETEDYMSS